MYPYESRLEWLLHSRYGHILRALELTPPGRDSLLHERAVSLQRWDRLRTGVMVLLYLGFAGTAVALLGNYVPGIASAAPLLAAVIRVVGGITGALTVVYLFLTRLLSQIEADILMVLASKGTKVNNIRESKV